MLGLGLSVIVSAVALPLLLRPEEVRSQFPSIVAISRIYSSFPQEKQTWTDRLLRALKKTIDIAFKNALSTFLNKMAYDSAVYIATGGEGQKPLFLTDFGQYFRDAGNNALGDYLDRLARETWGISLCQQPPFVQARLEVAARRAVDPGTIRASCPLSRIGDNFENIGRSQLIGDLVEFQKYFNPEASELGALFTITETAKQRAIAAEELAELQKLIEGGFQSVVNPITGIIQTPAAVVEGVAKALLPASLEQYGTYTGTAVADAIGVFTNTLTSKLLERYFNRDKGGFNPGSGSFGGTGGFTGGVAAARAQFASLAQPTIRSGGPYDILNELTCTAGSDEPEGCAITEQFRSAIEQQLTVRQAIDQGFLNSDVTFGFDAGGGEPEVKDGYPYRSMVVLRTNRIVPVGWELAALYNKDVDNGTYNIADMVEFFDDCDPVTGSAYCGLVDPNWVLKAPENYCRRQGFGNELISDVWEDHDNDPTTPKERLVQRAETCVDEQTCIIENPDGSCKAYGHCVEEQPIWHFTGDSCNDYYNTCQGYTDSAGRSVAYLDNTLDAEACNESNAGCRAYCLDYDNATGGFTCSETSGQKINLDGDAASCQEQSAGCSEFLRVQPETNLIPNDSFETFTGTLDDGVADDFAGWTETGTITAVTDSRFDRTAVTVPAGGADALVATVATGLPLAGRTFIFSYYAKADVESCEGNFTVGAGAETTVGSAAYTPDWQRFDASIAFSSAAPAGTDVRVAVRAPTTGGCTITTDATQLEVVELSDYRGYGVSNQTYLKPPAADVLNRNPGFESYAGTADDVTEDVFSGWVKNKEDATFHASTNSFEGSTALQLASTAGLLYSGAVSDDITVPAGPAREFTMSAWIRVPSTAPPLTGVWQLHRHAVPETETDCPSWFLIDPEADPSCHHYDVVGGDYTWDASDFDESSEQDRWVRKWITFRTDADVVTLRGFVINVLAGSTGEFLVDGFEVVEGQLEGFLCSQDEVGCERYTPVSGGPAISGVALAGDQCDAEFVGCQAYTEMPVFNGTDPDALNEAGEPVRSGRDLLSFVAANARSCPSTAVGCEEFTNLDVVAAGGEGREYYSQIRQCSKPDEATCSPFYSWEGSDESGYQLRAWSLTRDDTSVPPGAPQTYDGSGDCSDVYGEDPDCTEFYNADATIYYRLKSRTVTCSDDCHPLRNTFDEQTYLAIPTESTQCPAVAAGCREYRGNAGFNTRTILEDDFEDGDSAGWTGGTISTESTQVGGHSLRINATTAVEFVGGAVPASGLRDFLTQGKPYFVELWAKGPAGTTFPVKLRANGDTGTDLTIGTLDGANDWNFYRLGPLVLDRDPGADREGLVIEHPGPVEATPYLYVDNIQFQEADESIYLVADSWGATCDGNENCEAYTDRAGETHNLKSFSRLCPDGVVGCEAMIDTQNSTTPFEQTVAGVTTPADSVVYRINDSRNQCHSDEKGCTKLGLPTLDREGAQTGFETSYLINDPDRHDEIICQDSERFCDAYTYTDSEGTAYFKNPGDHTCEYKRVTGQTTAGWYKNGTNEGPPDCPVVYPPPSVGQPTDTWVGSCPVEQSSCTEYIDPEGEAGRSLVANGGVEADPVFIADDGPWRQSPVGFGELSDTVARTGTRSIHQVAPPDGGVYQNIPIEAFVIGGSYTFDVWVRNSNPGGQHMSVGYIEWHDTSGDFCGAVGGIPVTPADGVTEWTHYQQNFTAPVIDDPDCDEPVASIRIWPVQSRDTGEVWFDDIAMVPTSSYFLIKNTVDTNSCAGVVGRPEGCRLFNDTSTPDLPYDADSSLDGSVPAACSSAPGTCDSNTVVAVRPDRSCNQWLACKTSMEIVNPEGRRETVCLETGLCATLGEDGQCASFVQPAAENQTYDHPAEVASIANLSGLSRAGLAWSSGTIEGNLPTGAMTQVGLGGQGEEIAPNGTFDEDTDDRCGDEPVEWSGRNGSVFIEEDGDEGCRGSDDLNENNVLQITPSDLAWSGGQGRVSTGVGEDAIRAGVEYTVSFRIRYVNAPDPVDRVRIELAFNGDGGDVYSIMGDIQPTTGWQTFALGPIVAPAHNPTAATYLNFIRHGDSITSTAFQIDDVSLKPVLKVQNTDSNVARSCRAFPTEEAPTCDYSDENGVIHRGWTGYCLEYDPHDSSECLAWWPVDILAGESDVLGTFTPAGYAGPRPVFYCQETAGDYRSENFNLGTATDDEINVDQGGRAFTDERLVKRYRVPIRTVKVFEPLGLGFCVRDMVGCHEGAEFGGGFCGCRENEWDEGEGGPDGEGWENVPAVTGDRYPKWRIEKIVWIVQGWMDDDDWPAPGSYRIANRENNWDVNWNVTDMEPATDGNNDIQIRTNFTDALGTPTVTDDDPIGSYDVYMNDGSDNRGGVWVTGLVYLREYCTVVAKVTSPTEDHAWVGRLNESTSTYAVDSLGYDIDRDALPFGAITPPVNDACHDPDDPTTWQFEETCVDPTTDLTIEPLQPFISQDIARSGAPYSCSSDGDCSGTMCVGGDEEGKSCDTPAKITACENSSGSCVGVGSAAGFHQGTAWARDRLKRLFAQSLESWSWQLDSSAEPDRIRFAPTTSGSWTPATATAMSLCNGDGRGPRPPDFSGDFCTILPRVFNLNVGVPPRGTPDDDVHVSLGDSITLYFNTSVDAEQLPLETIRIDWGDGAVQETGWGGAPKGDPAEPHLFSHSYTTRSPEGGFVPRVQIVDNWGWCSNDNEGWTDCDNESWVSFGGSIIVE